MEMALAQESSHQEESSGVRGITEGQIQGKGPAQNAAAVGKRVESRLAVLGPHAAGTDPSEGEFGNPDLHHDIVEADPTGAGLPEHGLLVLR